MWRTKARECGHKIHTTAIRYRCCERFDFCRTFDNTETIAQPLNDSTADKHTAFKCKHRLLIKLRRTCCEQTMLRFAGMFTCLHKHEAACAVSIFHHARRMTCLPKQCGLLI